jgi:hypothetical protein
MPTASCGSLTGRIRLLAHWSILGATDRRLSIGECRSRLAVQTFPHALYELSLSRDSRYESPLLFRRPLSPHLHPYTLGCAAYFPAPFLSVLSPVHATACIFLACRSLTENRANSAKELPAPERPGRPSASDRYFSSPSRTFLHHFVAAEPISHSTPLHPDFEGFSLIVSNLEAFLLIRAHFRFLTAVLISRVAAKIYLQDSRHPASKFIQSQQHFASIEPFSL